MSYRIGTTLLFLPVFQRGPCLRLEATPTKIQFGLTKYFTIICSVPKDNVPKLNNVSSIMLSMSVSDGNGTYLPVATINSVTGETSVSVKDAIGDGVIDNKGESFVSVTLLYPTKVVAGEYKCKVNCLDVTSKFTTFTENITVPFVNFDVPSLIDVLRNILISNDEMKSITDSLTWRLEKSKLWFFKRSEVYKGRRYYLSQQDPVSRSEQAMATCVLYGGYLAEIDDLDEFNFIKSFIKQFSGFKLVLIGGADEKNEQVWRYRASKTVVPQFLKQISNHGIGRNCLYLYDEFDWLSTVEGCYNTISTNPTRYLCEIPENVIF